jgi:hypothetical protein
MGQGKRFAPIVVMIMIFILLQAIFAAVDSRQTPSKAAREFIRDYYYLHPDMQDRLPADQRENARDFLNAKADDAALQGFNIDFHRHMFTSMEVNTISREGDTALVNITGKTRVAINPVYNVVGTIFRIGENYPVNVTLNMVKQDGRWLVSELPPG